MSWRSVALLALSMVLVPFGLVQGQGDEDAARDTSTVTFYGHVFASGLDNPMPANTEFPIGEENFGLGSFDWCTPVANLENVPPEPSPTAGCADDRNNKLALFSTAGFVDVRTRTEFLQDGGYALLHNERGQTKDIVLDPAGNVQATLYLSVDAHSWAVGNGYGTNCIYPHPDDVPCVYPYWGWDPGAQPDFVVDATLYMAHLGDHGANASDAPPILDAVEGGTAEIVAQGRVGPTTVMNGIPGSPNAIQFVVDLGAPLVTSIPRDKSFFMVYSFHSETAAGPVGIHSWRIWSGELFPPTFSLPVKNAFDVERVIPNFAHGKLAILGVMNTPWGSYDISPATVRLDISRDGSDVSPERIQRFGEFSVAHGGHYLPINVTWIWDFNGDHARPGHYQVTLSAANHQLSARAVCTASFDLVLVSDLLRPRNVAEGVCGQQTASDEFIETIRSGTESQGGS